MLSNAHLVFHLHFLFFTTRRKKRLREEGDESTPKKKRYIMWIYIIMWKPSPNPNWKFNKSFAWYSVSQKKLHPHNKYCCFVTKVMKPTLQNHIRLHKSQERCYNIHYLKNVPQYIVCLDFMGLFILITTFQVLDFPKSGGRPLIVRFYNLI